MKPVTKLQRTLIFEGGILHIKIAGYPGEEGSGELVVKEDDLDFPLHHEDEGYRILKLPRSELEEIRDYITKAMEEIDVP